MRDDRAWVFLKVVGREVVVRGHDEGIEEAPGAACDQPQRPRIGNRAWCWVRQGRGTAGPLRDDRRQHPQDHERSGDGQGRRLDEGDDASGRCGERHAAGHAPVESADIEGKAEPRLSGGDPLQHVPPRDEEAHEGPHDGVAHQPRLMCEKRDDERGLQQGEGEILSHRAQVAAFGEAEPSRQDPGEERQEGGQGDHGEQRQAPHRGGARWQGPPRQQGEKRGRRRQRSAQVVHHLPAADERDRLPCRVGVRVPPTAEDPGNQLPIAACPTVLARRGNVVTGGELLDDLDVGDESGARKSPFEKVVTEHRALRNPPVERGLEDVHVIDSLAGVGALAEQILVHVGDGEGVRIHAAGAGEHALEQRSLAPGRQRRRDPRLQDRVPLGHTAGARIEQRAVEGVRHLPDQSPGGSARQARVGVEGDHVANAGGHGRRATADGQEGRVGGAAQKSVQLVQLAALAFPADPFSLAFVPDAPAMEQEEAIPVRPASVSLIQARDAGRGGGEQLLVPGALSVGESVQSESRAKQKSSSGLAR